MLFTLLFFILGTILGSFGSVILVRLSKKCDLLTIKGIIIGRSVDRTTGRVLQRHELIPIYSRIVQKGKSTHSKKPISSIYLILEIVCGMVTALTYAILSYTGLIDITTGMGVSLLVFWIGTNWLLTLLLIRDIYTLCMHMPVWRLTFLRVFLGEIILGSNITQALITAGIITLLFIIIYLGAKLYAQKRYHIKEGLGEGDIWLGVIIGLLFPFIFSYHNKAFDGLTIAYAIALYFAIASIVGIIGYYLQFLGKQKKTHLTPTLPFFPGMIISFRVLLIFFSHL